MRFSLIALLLLAGVADAQESIVFECQSGSDWKPDGEVVLEASIVTNTGYGLIQFAGAHHLAMYELQGFNHRWDFGRNAEDNGTNYAFIIKPDGTALYVDFSSSAEGEKTQASQVYVCKLTEQEASQ